ncbi:MAG: hypothetical protein COW05_08360 [Gammaproteobacteria bacterium CG12_big_fil_rev_8_21_14_0_65_46_12]|nr:MAG: hypothetical protein COW05_08360 [Gammaproteobacteria bacterium CG12_big_fil_rev_8_21_14_0_65_46_12]
MDYKAYFIELLIQFLNGVLSREEVARQVAVTMPIDTNYVDDEKLMNNCEWALRHINEPDHYSTEGELSYYLSCLRGETEYSQEERDNSM